jgi:AraC-like DNA-binding protein/mannose-6-phosphate isomerase-like protein (cupin superfamily)
VRRPFVGFDDQEARLLVRSTQPKETFEPIGTVGQVDILAAVLGTASVRGSVAATLYAGEGWGLRMAQVPGAAFHAVTSGSAHLEIECRPPIRLMPGDVVLLPTGVEHTLLGAPGAQPVPFDHVGAEAALTDGGRLVVGDPPVTTQIICASYEQDPAARWSPFTALPLVVHVPALSSPPGLRTSLSLISDELAAAGPGLRPVLDHVVNIVLIQLLRAWVETSSQTALAPSWLRGLAHPTTRRALAELHRDPAFPWTIDALARQVGVSRATLARHFGSEVGTSPGSYLNGWRMELAARSLRSGDGTVGTVARSVGYQSEYAFNRAFARHHGMPPGRYRSAARRSPAP